MSTRERFPHFYQECFVPLSNRYEISKSIPFGDPTSSLTHRSVSGFHTICNNSSSPLAGIVRISPLHIVVILMVLMWGLICAMRPKNLIENKNLKTGTYSVTPNICLTVSELSLEQNSGSCWTVRQIIKPVKLGRNTARCILV